MKHVEGKYEKIMEELVTSKKENEKIKVMLFQNNQKINEK